MKSRIMYMENKAGGLIGPARIGRVTFSKTGKTIYYQGMRFQSLKGGYKCNFYELGSGEDYWISGCHKNGADRLYGERVPIVIDNDVREEYWEKIRELSEHKDKKAIWGAA